MKNSKAALTLLLFLASACWAGPAQSVALDSFLGRGLTVHATIGGKPGTFLFDTGGGVTNVAPNFAKSIGCKPWGKISGFTMMGQRLDMQRCDHVDLQLGSESIPLETIGVFDGSGMMPPGAPHLDGTIALDALAGRAFAFSYTGRQITLLDRRSLASSTQNHTAMPTHLVRDAEGLALAVNLPVETDQGTAWFELDSGNVSPFYLVGKHLSQEFRLKENSPDTQQLQSRLQDGSAFSGPVKLFDLVLDGNLGTTFLEHFDVILDLSTARAWLVPIAPHS